MLALLIDKSGSMYGDPMKIVQDNSIALMTEYFRNRESQKQPVNHVTLAFDNSYTEIREANI